MVTRGYSWPVPSWPDSFYCKVHSSKTLMGIWATNLLHRFSDATQLCCALEVGTFFLKILLRIAIMAILSSIPPLSNSQTLNTHFELTRDIFRYDILPAVDSYRSHVVVCLKNVLKTVFDCFCIFFNWSIWMITVVNKFFLTFILFFVQEFFLIWCIHLHTDE